MHHRSCDNALMKRSSLWLLPFLLAVLVGGSFYFDRQAAKGDREINVYVTGGQRMAAGEEIYRRGLDKKPFTYPPFAAMPFVPFAKLPASWYASAWFLVNFLILIGVIRWLHSYASSAGTGRSPPRLWLFWALTVVFGGRHVVSVFTNQSHDLIIAGLLALVAASWCSNRRLRGAWAGLWAGLAAATKATPLIFLGLFGLRLHWVGIVSILLVTIGATLLPDYMFPRTDGVAWWQSWYDVNLSTLKLGGTAEAPGAWNSHSVLNQSVSGTVKRLCSPVEIPNGDFVVGDKGQVLFLHLTPDMTRLVTLSLSVVVLALISACVLCAKRAVHNSGSRLAELQHTFGLGEVAAFACGMVLLSPQSSKAHFCVWLFPVAFVVNFLIRSRRDGIGILLFSVALILGMLSKGMLGKPMANLMLAYGSVAWSTFFLLLATFRCLQIAARSSTQAA